METDTNLLNMYRERVREDDEKIAALQSRLDAALDALGKLPERAFHEGHSAGVSAGHALSGRPDPDADWLASWSKDEVAAALAAAEEAQRD